MRAHPRSRGENLIPTVMQLSSVGSSPLTRGKHLPAHGVPPHAGLIPAHAGKTGGGGVSPVERPAHPRSRGENLGVPCRLRAIAGSSPLTRGKPRAGPRRRRASGLIPAHAGKTARVTRLHRHQRAHPRSRGENGFARLEGGGVRGSSPLTRGKPPPSGRYQAVPRLIPAHAGKTARRAHIHDLGAAHPRSRGENASIADRRSRARGSSPLTRGKR